MSNSTGSSTLQTTPTLISSSPDDPTLVINTSNVVVYIGAQRLLLSNAVPLAPTEALVFGPGPLYGMVTSGTAVISYATGASMFAPSSIGGGVAENVNVLNFPGTQNVNIVGGNAIPPTNFNYGTVTIAPAGISVLVTITASGSELVWGFHASGDGDGLVELQVNGATFMATRISAASPSIENISPSPKTVNPGDVVRLQVTALGISSADYEGDILLG